MNLPQPDSEVPRRAQTARPAATVSTLAGEPAGGGGASGPVRRKARLMSRRSAGVIAATYALCGAAWIGCSDWLLSGSVSEPRRLDLIRDCASLAFVLGTGLLLYVLLRLTARARERLEAALRDSDEHFRIVGDNSADVVWILDLAADRYTFVSPSVHRLLGFTPGEMASLPRPDILAPGSASLAAETLPRRVAALQAGDESVRMQADVVELKRKDGSTVFADVVTTLMTDQSGRTVRMLGVVRDATVRRSVESELRRTRQCLEHAERLGRAGSWTFDLKSETIWASPEARRFLGFDDHRITNAEVRALVPAEFLPGLDQALRDLVERGEPHTGETRIKRASDGALVDICSVAEYDRINGVIVGVTQDVSDRKRAEERLLEQSARLASLSTNMPGMIFQLAVRGDGTTVFQFISESVLRVIGVESGAVLADSNALFGLIQPDNRAEFARRSGSLDENRLPWHWEGRAVVDGRTTWLRWISTSRPQPDGSTIWDGVILDVTASKQVEARIREQAELLDAANDAVRSGMTEKKQLEAQLLRAQRAESLGALAGGMAHDLNNVLAPFLMAIPMLQEEDLTARARKLLKTLEDSAQRGAGIVRQVLTFARGIQEERAPLQPGLILDEASKTARETFPKNIRIEVRLAADLGLILGDPAHLRRAVLNLCGNARDAMPEGGDLTLEAANISVDEQKARETPGARPGLYVCLSVTDTGKGIPPESLGRIFDPFFTTKAPGKGSGLGLSTVMGVSRSHGGFVRVASTVGRGSRFELCLPVTDVPRPDAIASGFTRSPFADGGTILVVDDEAAVCELIRNVLERHGYHVLAANGGAAALQLFERHKTVIKAVITDMMMPNIDGLALVRLVRRIDPAVRIIGISGAGDRAMLDKIQALGLAGFLAKPFSVEVLLRLLQEILIKPPDARG